MIQRSSLGLRPRAPRLEEDSYLDFMESLRNFNIRTLFPKVVPLTFEAAAERSPVVRTWKRLMRSQQQQTWQKISNCYRAERARWEQELERAAQQHPERLHYDPDFKVPAYATLDIHLQPGGYCGDSLAGYVFHHGTRVFYQGDNDQDGLHQQVVDAVATPADGNVMRVLDLGCSIGQCTTALKQRFPQAEVTGLDVGLPLLRYAHKRALDIDVTVAFRQGLAEDTGMPADTFDVILCYILFHEVPARLFPVILKEIYRLLRPGGRLTIVDAPNNSNLPPPNRMWLQFDAHHNCEPYSPAFVASDFQALITAAGLRVIDVSATAGFLSLTKVVKDESGN